MSQLWWLVWRQWSLRPWRAALSVFSVAIAVSAMLGTSIARSMVHEAYRAMTVAVNGAPALDLIPEAGGRVAQSVLPAKPIAGVRSIVPLLFRGTILRFQGERSRVLVVGVEESSLRRGVELRCVVGEFPTDPAGALIDRAFAEGRGIKVGDKLTLLGRRGPRVCYVRGLIDPQVLRDFGDGATVVLPLATAQDFFGLPDQIDRGRVFLMSAGDRSVVRDELAQLTRGRFFVRESARSGGIAEETLRSAELALYFSTALSLVTSIVVVISTLRMNFHERRRELAIIRALGASQRQIGWLLAMEGIMAGCLGAIAGMPLGVGTAYVLSRVLNNLLLTPQAFAWPHWTAIVVAVAVGELAVIAAIVWTRWGAEKIPPAEAMRELDVFAGERTPWKLVCGAVACWCATLVLLEGVRREWLPDKVTIPAGLLMLTSFVTTLPALLPLVLRWQGSLIPPRWWLFELLSVSQLARRPVRIGMTAGVTVVAISSGLGLGSTVATHIQEVRDWYRRTMSGDFVLTSTGSSDSPDKEWRQVRAAIGGVAGVESVEGVAFLPSRIGNESIICVVRDFDPAFPLPWTVAGGDEKRLRASLADGQAVLSSVLARRLGVTTGGSLVMECQSRNHLLRVADIVSDYNFGGMCLFLQSTPSRQRLRLGAMDVCIVRATAASREGTALPDQLGKVARENGYLPQSFAEIRHGLDRMLNGIVAALWTLIAIGYVVSGLSIANTLAMHVSEQTREIGLLRVVGMTAARVRRLIVFQALLLGAASTFLGTLAGITTGLVINWCGEPLTGRAVPFEIPPLLFAANVLGAILVTVCAALIPAWRASHLELAKALAYD